MRVKSSTSKTVFAFIRAKQFDEVRVTRVGADHKGPLSETVEDRLAARDIGRDAGGDNEQLARLGGIRIPEDRRGYVALPVPRMLACEHRRGRRTYRAHRQVNCTRHQTRGQTVEIVVAATKHDLAHGIVVWQHTDHELAVEQVTDIRWGLRPSVSSLPI